ncbi:hypothetical protein [Paraburkholderia bannensis]|uniref:hypothetical protein n=1 Tax=Paraburkholderia bannensis TaxID=765414 RepID=UPI002ABDF81A|nr:hypothetical protein [Paraburkholderia bannensis]
MSYDLFFEFQSPVQAEELDRYFGARPHYLLSNGAFYQNPATGIYFQFTWSTGAAGSRAVSSAAFNMNFFRPHVFALEAEPEVHAFIQHFSVRVRDPQKDGMGDGPYSTNGFLTGWNTGNEYAYEAILTMQAPSRKFYTLPADALERVWKWNASIASTQASYGESLFVPRIMPLSINGQLRTVVVWGDGIPELFPEVDMLLVVRDELAPESSSGVRQKDKCLIAQRSASEILAPLTDDGYALRVRKPAYNVAPDAVRKFIRSLAPTTDHIAGVAMDSILDEELVHKFTKST